MTSQDLRPSWLAFAVGLSCLFAATAAHANDRKFTYTYETAVLPPGGKEVEVWTTWHTGRDDYFSRFAHRLEFELGVVDQLMTAFYLNFYGQAADNADGERVSSFLYDGISWEWKYKLTDPVADPIGFGLYGELGATPDEYKLEAKLLLDKYFGDFLAAFNLVGEVEWELGPEETERELEVKPVLGLSYLLNPYFSFGIEAQNENQIGGGEFEHSIVSAGPVVSYADEGYWATLTFLPQWTDLKEGQLDLTSHERYELRLLFAMHLGE